MGDGDEPTNFWFSPGPHGEDAQTLNTARAPFDRMLAEAARDAGATIFEQTDVQSIDRLVDGDVALTTSAGPIRGRMLIDASGQSTVVGRLLKTRQVLPDLRRVAYYSHFAGVERRSDRLGGSPIIVMCTEGWFWVIPLDEDRTSVGLVVSADVIRAAGVPAERALAWGIGRSPYLRSIMTNAVGPERNHVAADFSYRCAPFAGPGYFLVGDAATFVDPIFSTGVCMGMMSAIRAVDAAADLIARPQSAERVRSAYCQYVDSSSAVFFRMVRRYYTHAFREMFLHGTGPLGIHRAVLSVLAGHVFPRPVWKLRWRLALFEALMRIHERVRPLVPTRRPFSLLAEGARTESGGVFHPAMQVASPP
jgi:flavin-dependent dehydrogenase